MRVNIGCDRYYVKTSEGVMNRPCKNFQCKRKDCLCVLLLVYEKYFVQKEWYLHDQLIFFQINTH